MIAGLEWSDPRVLGAAALAVVLVLVLRAARLSARTAAQLGDVAEALQHLERGQYQVAGALKVVTEHQSGTQTRMIETLERRLEEVQRAMGQSLHGTATRTARSLGELHQRLEAIDRAQTNIEKLSGDVLGLQDILANKQTRGAFGEIQMGDILTRALPADAFTLQATLSNGKRADALIHMPSPPGPIAVDAKFPLEAYEALQAARTDPERAQASAALRRAVQVHIRAIAGKYIVAGETADSALMFLPSEAVYAELHASLGDVVREGFALRVWIVSPTTLMATLNTVRAILKDVRMREQAGAMRRELGLLAGDIGRLETRVANLDRHFDQAARDVEEITISAGKAGARARRIEAFEFESQAPNPAPDQAPTEAAG